MQKDSLQEEVFHKDGFITRAEFVSIVNGVLNLEGEKEVRFKDVSKKDWFYQDIAIAVSNKYLAGFSDNTIRPNNLITKKEAAAILSRFITNSYVENKLEMVDRKSIPDWCLNSISMVVNNEIMELEDNYFNPNKMISKGQVLSWLNSLSKKMEEGIYVSHSETFDFEDENFRRINVAASNVKIKNGKIECLIINKNLTNISVENMTVERMIFILEDSYSIVLTPGISNLIIDTCENAIKIRAKSWESLEFCKLNEDIEVSLEGNYKKLIHNTSNGYLDLSSYSSVEKLVISSIAIDNKVRLRLNSEVSSLEVNGRTSFLDWGNIVFAKGDGLKESTFFRLPENLRREKSKSQDIVKKHNVNFYDFYGNLIKNESVEKNKRVAPPEPDTISKHCFVKWNTNDFDNIQSNLEVYPIYKRLKDTKEIKIKDLGEKGFFTDTNNVYKIDDNSFLGVKTLVVAKNRLPYCLNQYNRFEFIMNDMTKDFKINIFDENLLILNVDKFAPIKAIENSTFKAYLE